MISYSQIVDGIKNELSPTDAKKTGKIDTALEMALDEMSMRLKSVGMLKKQEVSIAADDRDETLTGDNDDLKYLLYVKYGTGDEQEPITYVNRKEFLKTYDNPSVDAGTPKYWTILEHNDDGFPKIKFDVPAESSDTLTIYYFPKNTPQSIVSFRSQTPIVTLALAYFHGRASEIGANYYKMGWELVKLAMASDSYSVETDSKFQLPDFARTVNDEIQVLRDRRY